jgi:putative hydrolase of the HAD superfamily
MPPLHPIPRAVIFDLDNCLADAREVGNELFEEGFQAIRDSNTGWLAETALEAAFSDCWRHPLDWVAERHGFSPEMLRAGWEAFSRMEVRHPMHGYGDLPELLKLPQHRVLVTSGFRHLQESKIRALNLSSYVHELYVDAIDEPDRIGKKGWFQRILASHGLTPAETFVVGDSAASEIAAGNSLGMPTVQILRPGVPRSETAQYHIASLAELPGLLGR